jgi:hypothetical protein
VRSRPSNLGAKKRAERDAPQAEATAKRFAQACEGAPC